MMKDSTRQTLQTIYTSLDDNFGEDIQVIDIDKTSNICEFFVIVTGKSSTHVQALAGNLEKKMKDTGVEILHLEGHRANTWILLDYGDVIVHIFDKENREFYNLDKLWSDGTHLTKHDIFK